jgi:rubrerythrin
MLEKKRPGSEEERMETQDVCYTREVAIEKAIEMESQSFAIYKNLYLKVKDRLAKDVLKDLALDELKHKYTLERAYFEDTVELHDAGQKEGPSMQLTLLLQEKPLDQSASDQDVMVFAIHEEKRSVDFYKAMAGQCGGAPMEKMFSRLAQDEEGHLSRLETLYESLYMQDM